MKKRLAPLTTVLFSVLLSCVPGIAASGDTASSALHPADRKYLSEEGSWQARFAFSEAVIVSDPRQMMFLAGVGSEEEGAEGAILHAGDAAAQCRYAWEKIERLLRGQGGQLKDIVKVTTYVTDARFRDPVGNCRRQAFAGVTAHPPHTFVTVTALAEPTMLVEIDVIAVLSAPK